MPHFAYKGRDQGGRLVQGVLEGADSGAVAGQLYGSGITPIEIAPSSALPGAGPGLLARLREQSIGDTDILLFCRHMYTLLKAGVPIMGALKGLQESAETKALTDIIQDIRENLDSGRELSACLARHPKVFDPFYVSMVRVGELTGTLEEVFLRLFHHLEFEKFMREQVKSALRYPSFVVGAMALAIVVINIFVIPAFAKVYQGFKTELPAMTKGLIAFSNFTVAYWPIMLAVLAVAYFAFRAYVGTTN